MAELTGPVAHRLRAIQERYDPRMAAELPPHITLVGSSGMGPIPSTTSLDDLTAALERSRHRRLRSSCVSGQRCASCKAMSSCCRSIPTDRSAHSTSGSSRADSHSRRPDFTFTPHCTLSFYPEISRERERELLRVRIDEAV
jgi:hypothetical protein